MSQPGATAPAELILARFKAFQQADFGFIYDSYHPDSNFMLNFPDRSQYLEYGSFSLQADFRMSVCRILRVREEETLARVISYYETSFQQRDEAYFELATLQMTAEGWRYLSMRKLSREEFSGTAEKLSGKDFENCIEF